MSERTQRSPQDDADFITEVRAVLDEGNAALDGYVLSRLTRARHAALEAARPRSRWLPWSSVLAGAAAALVVAVMLRPGGQVGVGPGDGAPRMEAGFDDLEIVLAEEGLEFYEDLDFYEDLALAELLGTDPEAG